MPVSAPADGDKPNTKFDAAARQKFIESLRRGNMKFESARLLGVSYRTVQRHMSDDDTFREDVAYATAEAREGIEKVLFDMAMQGDISAIKMWQTAHDRSTYGDKHVIEIDATENALEMSRNQAIEAVVELQKTLAERRARLLDTGDIVDAPSEELSPNGDNKVLSPYEDNRD